PDDLRTIHAVLIESADEPGEPGEVRSVQTWIGGKDVWPHDADYIPPPPEELPGLLLDLCAFINRTDLPGLLQAAIAHAQFEAIHPFLVGNGRVGRCLIHVVLRRRGLAPRYIPPVSLVLATDQRSYVRGLTTYREYTSDAVASWIGLFAQAVRRSAQEAEGFAERIAQLQAEWRRRASVQ